MLGQWGTLKGKSQVTPVLCLVAQSRPSPWKHLGLGQRDWEDEEGKQRSPVVWKEMIEAELNLASLCFLTLLEKQSLQGEDNSGLFGQILSPWSGPFRARRVWWWGRISSLTWSVVLARNCLSISMCIFLYVLNCRKGWALVQRPTSPSTAIGKTFYR